MVKESQWQGIKENNQNYDNVFWYGVKSTKIFCKPSCASRLPKKENVTIYHTPEGALAAGYRPCKRCQPLGAMVPNELWVQQINEVILKHYADKLSLEELAALAHGSPSYMRQVYQKFQGLTPQQQISKIRLEKAAQRLIETTESIAVVGEKIGMPNTAYFIQQFKQRYGVTPLKYRKSNKYD